MSITQFTMEEVRCFSERQTLEIRPLTFLVGENSTGKTTALACFHVLARYLQEREVDFNSHPYSMGTFKDIVRNSRKKDKTFKLGFAFKNHNEVAKWTVEFVEKKGGFEPAVSSVTLKFPDGKIVLKPRDNSTIDPRVDVSAEKPNQYQITCPVDRLESFFSYISFSLFRGSSVDALKGHPEVKSALENYCKAHDRSIRHIYGSRTIWRYPFVFSTSPIRSQPKRTYDPTREFNDPEGSDIPMYLTRIEATKEKDWESLKKQLIEFGKSSGLFQNIEIKKLGRSLGAPFQLQFKVRGPKVNIIDVGYGVSQILPILVQILSSDMSRSPRTSPRRPTFSLLQQPEVHLHPRAQAEFSSLLTKLASQGNRSFIVETHSDYMIDRARIEIRKGNIRPEDVSLIYFEPKGRIVKVHNINFDKMANMTSVPPHYRDFFLKESKRLMGFED